jgi:DNA-binding transcriptional regulator LsrR (DeoR family)
MAQSPTADQVVDAARELGQEEFTRGDIAGKIGVEKPDVKSGFNEAKKAGRIEKTRDDENNTGHFKLTD